MKPKILLADDDEDVTKAISEVFVRHGFEVATVSNLDRAKTLLLAERFNLLITDLRIAAGDGAELVKIARMECPGTDVVILTGYAGSVPRWCVEGPWAVKIIKKPFAVRELLAVASKHTATKLKA